MNTKYVYDSCHTLFAQFNFIPFTYLFAGLDNLLLNPFIQQCLPILYGKNNVVMSLVSTMARFFYFHPMKDNLSRLFLAPWQATGKSASFNNK